MNRSAFYASLKASLFGGRLGQKQVDGMNILLDTQERYFPNMASDQLAYVLGTVYHETGATMQPIKEIGGSSYFKNMYDIHGSRPAKARELGNLKPGDGARFPGMGFVQITGRSNAQKATKLVRQVTGDEVDFEKHPDLLMDPEYSSIIAFYGMVHGIFTGKKLSSYIDNDGKEDPGEFTNSRRIINGMDRSKLISSYAKKFLGALKKGDEVLVDLGNQATGKPLIESKTAWATSLSSAAGGVAVASEVVSSAQTVLSTASETWDLIIKIGPWVLAAVVIAVCAWIIISERYKKSVELGV